MSSVVYLTSIELMKQRAISYQFVKFEVFVVNNNTFVLQPVQSENECTGQKRNRRRRGKEKSEKERKRERRGGVCGHSQMCVRTSVALQLQQGGRSCQLGHDSSVLGITQAHTQCVCACVFVCM